MPVNYATQYAQSLSQAYPNVLHFGALFARKQEGDYRWANSRTIEVPTVSVTGRTDASRGTIGNKTTRHSNTWKPLTLRNHRKWDDLIHPRDIDETNQVLSIQNITRVYNQEEKFPEMDKYLASTLYSDWTALGRVPFAVTLTTANVLTYFDYMMENATEHNVPMAGRILYITPKVDTLLKNASSIYRNIDISAAPAGIQRALSYIDTVNIEVVPSDHMLTAYDFTVGAVKGVSAKQIQMMLVHPTCVITPVAYEFAQLDAPSAGTDGHYVYFEESQEDVFILPNKQYALDFIVEEIPLDTVTFTSAAGTVASGDTKLTVTAPSPVKAGTRYWLKTNAATFTDEQKYGDEVTGYAEINPELVGGVTNGHYGILILTDADGRIYGKSAAAAIIAKA